jgi:small-conductance mechanosensitive channel
MWGWIVANSTWILIGSGAVVILLLLFSDQVQRFLDLIEPDNWKIKPFTGIVAWFWYIEAVALALALISLAALAYSDTGIGSLLTTDSIKAWFSDKGLGNIITVIVGVIVWVIIKQGMPPAVRRIITAPREGESPEGLQRRAKTIQGVFLGLARVIIILVVGLIIVADYQNIGPVLAGLGIVGIAVGFGAQYLVRDLIAGIFILLENQYRVGDVARVADVAGLVEAINLRKTVLRDLDGIVHHIPNGEIRVASNFSRHYSRVNLNISVSYGTDLDYAIGVINRVCQEMFKEERWKKVMISLPQVLRIDNLGDSGIDIKILGDVKPLEQWNVMGELRLRLKKEFDRVGIEIPWPHTKIYFGNRPEGPFPAQAVPEKEEKKPPPGGKSRPGPAASEGKLPPAD